MRAVFVASVPVRPGDGPAPQPRASEPEANTFVALSQACEGVLARSTASSASVFLVATSGHLLQVRAGRGTLPSDGGNTGHGQTNHGYGTTVVPLERWGELQADVAEATRLFGGLRITQHTGMFRTCESWTYLAR